MAAKIKMRHLVPGTIDDPARRSGSATADPTAFSTLGSQDSGEIDAASAFMIV